MGGELVVLGTDGFGAPSDSAGHGPGMGWLRKEICLKMAVWEI